MKKHFIFMLIACLAINVGLNGCSKKDKQVAVKDAIAKSKNIASTQEKVGYLIEEARKMAAQDRIADAHRLGNYILTEVDSESEKAQQFFIEIGEQFQEHAEEKMLEVQERIKKLENLRKQK